MTHPNDPVYSDDRCANEEIADQEREKYPIAMGLTKREYFAIRIMQGFCSYESKETTSMQIADWEKKWAYTSLRITDALIEALNSGVKK
jgi:hypothetical protein